MTPEERDTRRAALDARVRAYLDRPIARSKATADGRAPLRRGGTPASAPPLAPLPAWSADGRAPTGLTIGDGPESPGTGAPIGAATVVGWTRVDGRATVRIVEHAPAQGPLTRVHREPGMPVNARELGAGYRDPGGDYSECPGCGVWCGVRRRALHDAWHGDANRQRADITLLISEADANRPHPRDVPVPWEWRRDRLPPAPPMVPIVRPDA